MKDWRERERERTEEKQQKRGQTRKLRWFVPHFWDLANKSEVGDSEFLLGCLARGYGGGREVARHVGVIVHE